MIEEVNELIGDITPVAEITGEMSPTNDLTGEININSSGGTLNYEYLYNQPSVNNVTLIKNKSFEDLGMNEITNTELSNMFNDL